MNSYKKIFLIFTFGAISFWSFAQSGISGGISGATQSEFPQFSPNVLPPSPDAWSFTRYGSLPIGLNTGTAQYSLPVYNIQSGSLSHPISISYSSNGVKVDEMATRVGINWSLKTGGIITRTVLDLPDGAPGVYPTYFHGPITWDTAYTTSWDLYEYVRQASYAARPDYQPDEYSFNVDGYSGKFLKRENGEFTQFNSSGVKIEKSGDGFILTAPNGTKYYFMGYEIAKNYSFPENTVLEWVPQPEPTAWYLTKILSTTRDSIVFNYSTLGSGEYPLQYKNGISQDYHLGTVDYWYVNTSHLSTNKGVGDVVDRLTGTPSVPPMTTLVQMTDNTPLYLTSITFNNGTAEFKYSSRMDVLGEKKLDSIKVLRAGDNKIVKCVALQYTYSNATAGPFDTYIVPGTNYTAGDTSLRKRLFLTSFDDVAVDLSGRQRQTFEYEDINGLPPRLSFSQDRHGSFNGKANTTYFFPNDTWYDRILYGNFFGGDRSYHFNSAKKGMLKKITYPTGGYTLFNYEPNKTEIDYAFTYLRDSVYALLDTSEYIGQEFYSDTIYHDNQKSMRLKGYCEWASNPVMLCDEESGGCTEFDNQYYITFEIINAATGSPCGITYCTSGAFPVNSFNIGLFGTNLPSGNYYIKGIASKPRLRARITLEEYWKISDRSDSSGVAGVRVKYISDFANDSTETNRREFIYGQWSSPDSSSGTGLRLDMSNGNEVSMTRVIATAVHGGTGVFSAVYAGYNTIHSSSVYTNFLTENNTVLYAKVIELNIHPSDSTKNNGGTEYEFYYDQKKYPIPLSFYYGYHVWEPAPIVPNGAQYMNNDFRTGMQKSSKTFTYFQKHGTRSILQETKSFYSVDTSTLIIDTFLVSREVLKREERVPSWIYFWDYDIYRYWRYFGFLKQDSVVQVTYAPSGQLVNKVVYLDYDDHNYKPNYIKFYGSSGDIKAVSRKYICDVAPWETDYSMYYSMRQKNLIDNLLEESNYATDGVSSSIELAKKKMNYSQTLGLYLPSLVYSSQKAGTEYQEMAYQVYDSSGNLLQYTGRDGVVTAIIWGYGKTYPVAKIVGKTYSDALSQSSINMGVVNNPSSESAMKTELDKLRTLSGSFATTYIYSPLIGVTSQTDPNGNIIYYEYDNFSRLSLIRDKDRNVIKKICYNFQGQPVDCGYGLLAAWQPVSSICQVVSGTNTGNLIVTEKDMNPSSATYNQTRTVTIADARACPIPPACSGIDKKVINGVCETGVKVCTGNFRPPGQFWQHYYHYEWSDSSVSDTYIGQGMCL